MRNRLNLQFALSNTRRKHGAADFVRAALEHKTGRGKVIGKRVIDQIAASTPRREKRACRSPKILDIGLWLKNRTGGCKNPEHRPTCQIRKSAQRRIF